MDLRRLTRIISDRWPVFLIGGVVGLLGAILFLTVAAPSGDSSYEATATLRFEPAEGQSIPDLAETLRSAREFAVIAAQEQLSADPTAQITVDLAEAKLNFTSRGTTETEAGRQARDLLESYLAVDPEISGSVDDELLVLEQQAIQLDEQIAELQPELTAEEQRLVDERTQVDLLIESVSTRLRELVLSEAQALTSEEQQNFAQQRENLEETLDGLRAERDALGPAPVAELTASEELLLQSLEARRQQLNSEYQRLYLRKLGVTSQGTVEGISIQDFAADPLDPVMVAALGLFGGTAVAAVGLMMVARTRRIVWMPSDIDIPVLGQIPARPVDARGNESWYYEAEPGPRKTAVQALRSAVQAQAHTSGLTVALTGHNISSEDVHALTADLAGSMASAGDSVLLIDANFDSRSALGAYRADGYSLSEILRLHPESPDFAAYIDVAVEQAHVVRPGLAVIPSGPPPGSPADALAGRQFRSLINAAESQYDVTILVVDDFGTPSSKVAVQRLRHAIIVTSPGSTTETEMNGLLDEAHNLRISVLGAVFVRRRTWLSRLFEGSESEPVADQKDREAPAPTPVSSPITRLQSYAIPDASHSGVVRHSPLGDFATSFGLSEQERDHNLGVELLAALHGTSEERSYDAVAEYVVSRAEDMVTARPGYGNLNQDLIDDVVRSGFLSLRPIKNYRTVGSWLTEEIEREVESESGAEVVKEFERLISKDQPDVGIDQWLEREFFERHLARFDGEPEVWHLVSPGGTVSLLLPGRRISAGMLDVVATEIGGIDVLERKRKAAVAEGDLEMVAELEAQIDDVREFEKRLYKVTGGDSSDGPKRSRDDAWHPDWSEGIRANLAPFQRHGLLPFDVLTDEEMATLLATA